MHYIDLHVHSRYSILDALPSPEAIAIRTAELGRTAVALTDHGVMYGIIDFYHACEKSGVKPILGCELYVAPISIQDKSPSDRYDHLVALAETNEGFKNLQNLCSEGFTSGGMYYGKPRVDDELLK